jgi:hypothetical protein
VSGGRRTKFKASAYGKLKPGMSGADVSALGDSAGGPDSRRPIAKDRVGYGIGLPPGEMAILRGDTKPVIQAGGVYAFHPGIDGKDGAALTSAVHVADDGVRVLCRYPSSGERGRLFGRPGRSGDGSRCQAWPRVVQGFTT